MAFSPDGKRALSGSDDETMRLWDVDSGKELRSFKGHKEVCPQRGLQPGRQVGAVGRHGHDSAAVGRRDGQGTASFAGHQDVVSV